MDANRILVSYRKKLNKIALCRMENDLVSEQLLKTKFNFPGNILKVPCKNRSACSENFEKLV